MSFYRSFANEETSFNRDPRRRDRSRSEIRRPNTTETLPTVSTPVQIVNQSEQSTSTNNVLDFFKTLGLNSQLIQALINANPPKIEEIPPPLPVVNNAQEFASFLSENYGLDSRITSPSVHRGNPVLNHFPSKLIFNLDSRQLSSTVIPMNHSPRSISIEESYKEFLATIDQTLFDNLTRQRLQRIALLDDELDRLHRMKIELNKTNRRRPPNKDKDSLLKENENLQHELTEYTRNLKRSILQMYSAYMIVVKQ